MGLSNYKGSVLFICTLVYLLAGFAAANVALIGRNVSLSFDDAESNFAPAIKGSGECGVLYLAEPLDACTPLTNKVEEGPSSPFVLIIRGECSFKDKIRHAQYAGFKAAIVYDNNDSSILVPMAGTPAGIHIHAVFVSKASGEILKKYAGHTDVELWIIPTFENSAWPIMVISFILLLSMSAVLATCFFVRRHCFRHEQPRVSNVREFHGMSSQLVKAMPSIIFTSVLEDDCTSSMCAICLEDYKVGEKLRVLPCHHRFHALCVDSWLRMWRTFCPVCKQDARTGIANHPASECTPFLSSGAPTPSSASISSFHSSAGVSSSPNIQIASTPWSEPTSWPMFLSMPPCITNPLRSYTLSPTISISRSSANLRNALSHRFSSSHMASSLSLGFPFSSPIHSIFTSPCIPNLSNASPSYLAGSSSQQSYHRHCTDSGISQSALASAQSMPGC